MAESNEGWGNLAEHDDELAQAWDSFAALPEAGSNPFLDAFCERKNITIQSLIRLGAKLAEDQVLAFEYGTGIKFRDVVSGKMWSYLGSTWPRMKIVRAGAEPSDQVIVCEGETDGARLTSGYDVDVAIMPGGARNFPESMGQQLDSYQQVLLGLDKDEAGEAGCTKIAQYHNNTVRFPAPGAGDWADVEGDLPALPEIMVQPEEAEVPLDKLLVPAGEMLQMEVPEIASWLEHDVLPIGGQLLIHGWAKSFKTYLALDLVSRLAQGADWCCFEPKEEPVRVGIIQFEITWPYYHKRMTQLREAATEKELYDANVFTWTPMRRPELIAGSPKYEDKILKALTENHIQIVLIDPIRRAIGEADLNAENEVRKMLRFFQRIQDAGITVVATHHDNKEGARAGGGSPVTMTGSGAFSGDADTIISVELPRGEQLGESVVRNLNFTLRNSPHVGARSMQMQDDGHIIYDTSPVNREAEEDDDDDAPPV
jgi:hypothetical protein